MCVWLTAYLAVINLNQGFMWKPDYDGWYAPPILNYESRPQSLRLLFCPSYNLSWMARSAQLVLVQRRTAVGDSAEKALVQDVWIRLVQHPVLPATRLLSRVPDMGVPRQQSFLSELLLLCVTVVGNRRVTVLFRKKKGHFKGPLIASSPIPPLVYCRDN